MSKEIVVGDLVPDFTLSSDQNELINIGNFKGKNIVIYFYPKDDTPGCTVEAKDFSCSLDKFTDLNTVIIGISRDSVIKHDKFKAKYELKHILLSDVDGEVCEKFNCWVEKSMYGRKYMGFARKTFLVDTHGKIIKIWPNVKIPGHVEEVIDSIKNAN